MIIYQKSSGHTIQIWLQILFLKNKRALGVSNGRFATITKVKFTESGKVINFSVRLDGTDKEILIDPEKCSRPIMFERRIKQAAYSRMFVATRTELTAFKQRAMN